MIPVRVSQRYQCRQEATHLSSVDELLSKTLGDGLDVSESSLSCTDGDETDSLVHSSKRRNINGLSSDSSGRTDSGRVFTDSTVDDGVDEDLDWVGVGKQVDDLESVLDDSDGHKLLSVVSSVHHQGVDQSLNDRALCLSETLDGISSSGVGKVYWVS